MEIAWAALAFCSAFGAPPVTIDFDGSYLAVALIGGLLGLCELLSRYKDQPLKAVWNWAAIAYIAVNVAAAILALSLIRTFGVDFGIPPAQAQKLAAVRILVAGLGAMAFFRTSLFTAKVGDQDIPMGPGIILQILLNVADRAVDRSRAKPRAHEITGIMAGVDFLKARKALPPLCFGLMQNVSPEEQKAIADQVNLIELPPAGESSRLQSILLGLLLLNLVGPDVLKAAISALKGDLTLPDPEPDPDPPAPDPEPEPDPDPPAPDPDPGPDPDPPEPDPDPPGPPDPDPPEPDPDPPGPPDPEATTRR
ncbi:MAG TPA: hypothetical protein VJS15_00475 [Allosphingosinicella sp.]|nr:hypothetical protein [Allosphingosinicella sp.]